MSMRRPVVMLAAIVLLANCLFGFGIPVGHAQTAGEGAAQAGVPPQNDLEKLEAFWQEAYGDTLPTRSPQWAFPLTGELLAKAQPDECYNGVGNPYDCVAGSVPKVNQAYVWGVTKVGTALWFGTAPNVHCLVLGSYLGMTVPNETRSWVCEFGQSQYSQLYGVPPAAGDWRPPQIFVYDTAAKTLTEKSPADPRFNATVGIRVAATLNEVILLGGVSMTGGINLFAYRADTGAYLGSINLPQYNNIRKGLVVNDVLYLGVANTAGGGSVLRWYGDVATPFNFEVVGTLDGAAAELAYHEGRIFVSTWPEVGVTLAGLWMSPPLPASGLNPTHAANWTKVWQVDAYEPDPVTAAVYGGGALASFGGYLYWGTMHVPLTGAVAHLTTYGLPADPLQYLAIALGTHRAISIFRGRNFTAAPEVELLYGNPLLPAYDPLNGWQIVANNMAARPRFGLAGFGNFFNNYTWSMAVYQDQLFVGTMDWSYLFVSELLALLHALDVKITSAEVEHVRTPPQFLGADLWRFPSSHHHAILVSSAGVGNYSNYGIRNMISDDALYLGMANPMNLLTDPADLLPEGGWELIGLKAGLAKPPVVGYVFIDDNADGLRQATEQTGLGDVLLDLTQYGVSGELARSLPDSGWYQFDTVMPGYYTLKAQIPTGYLPTGPTEITFNKAPGVDRLFNFGVERAQAAIGDYIWEDVDQNGVQDATEFGIEGVTVELLADESGAPGAVVAQDTTDVDGAYLFDWLMPGSYWVRVTDEQGVLAHMTPTTGPQSQSSPFGPITVAQKEVYREADFGYVLLPGSGQGVLAMNIWLDTNANGVRDPGEIGFPGVQICAMPLGYTRSFCTFSNAHGRYSILAPATRTYFLAPINPPPGLTPTTSPFYAAVVVRVGERLLDRDFGYR